MLPPLDLQGSDIRYSRGEVAGESADPGAAFAALFSAARGSDLPETGNALPAADLSSPLEAHDGADDETGPAGADTGVPAFTPDGLPQAEVAALAVLPESLGGLPTQASATSPAGVVAAATTSDMRVTLSTRGGSDPRRPGPVAPISVAGDALSVTPPLASQHLPAEAAAVPSALPSLREYSNPGASPAGRGETVVAVPENPAQPVNVSELTERPRVPTGLPEGGEPELLTRVAKASQEGSDAALKPAPALPTLHGAAPLLSTAAPTPSAMPSVGTLPAAIDLPVADPDWGNALGERVLWMAGRHMQTAEVRMNPAELGPLTVSVKVEDNTAHLSFTAHHAVTREAIEQALPRLREMFAAEGMTLANTDVADQGVRHGNHGNGRGGSSLAAGGGEGDVDNSVESVVAAPVPGHAGLVDTFV